MAKEPAANRDTRPGADHASRRTRRDRAGEHAGLRLSGDFDPQQVLASNGMAAAEKREIFEVWISELRGQPGRDDVPRMIAEIEDAIARLDREEETPKR